MFSYTPAAARMRALDAIAVARGSLVVDGPTARATDAGNRSWGKVDMVAFS